MISAVVESDELVRLEETIERGIATFNKVGAALMEIRSRKLYRATHKTFEAYCRERWGFTGQRARLLMHSTEVVETIRKTQTVVCVLPTNERQIRPLFPLTPEQQAEAWTRAVQSAAGKVTAAHVERAVQEVLGLDMEPSANEILVQQFESLPPEEQVRLLNEVESESEQPTKKPPRGGPPQSAYQRLLPLWERKVGQLRTLTERLLQDRADAHLTGLEQWAEAVREEPED